MPAIQYKMSIYSTKTDGNVYRKRKRVEATTNVWNLCYD